MFDPDETSRTRRLAIAVAMAVSMVAMALAVDNPKTQNLNMTVPYFSGAANYEFGQGWRIDPKAMEGFREWTPEDQRAFRFPAVEAEALVPYSIQAKGYLFVSLVARNLFFWQGDLQAVESLQILTHVLLTLFVISRLGTRRHRLTFFLLYGLNPLIAYYATYPIYYYWQTLPAALLVPYLLNRDFRYGPWAVLVAVSLAFFFQVRPTVVLLSMFFLVMILRREPRRVGLAAVAACGIALVAFAQGSLGQTSVQPWHAAMVGLGAYPNPSGLTNEDDTGFGLYERETGIPLNARLGGNFYEPETVEQYRAIVRRHYLAEAAKMPHLLLRNAILNFFESYSIGYLTMSLTLTYLSALSGAVFLALLLWRRRFDFAIAIGLCSGSFVAFYVPVPIYMFGAYALIVAGFISLLDDLPWWAESASA